MRLIDADTVVHWQSYDDEHETFPDHEGTIADFLDQMTDEGCPGVVDAVEVVRCKDCKHYQFADNRAFGFPVKCCEWTGFEDVDDYDFCSRGERKDGEHQ